MVSLLVSAVAWPSVAVEGLDMTLVAGAAGASVAAALVVLAWTWLEAAASAEGGPRLIGPVRLPVAGAVAAVLIWAGQLLGVSVAASVRWPPELWAGILLLTVLEGAALGLLLDPHPRLGAARARPLR